MKRTKRRKGIGSAHALHIGRAKANVISLLLYLLYSCSLVQPFFNASRQPRALSNSESPNDSMTSLIKPQKEKVERNDKTEAIIIMIKGQFSRRRNAHVKKEISDRNWFSESIEWDMKRRPLYKLLHLLDSCLHDLGRIPTTNQKKWTENPLSK